MVRALGSFPSGLVTFVFTDIEGSTQLLRRIGDRYSPLLERHREILREAWTAWGGCEVKTDGDSFFVAFSDPVAAIEACAQGQRAITAESWPADAVFRVRIGVHSGLASPRDRDYVALAVHQAARVVDAGHGGQVVVSSDTAERATDAARIVLAPLGRYRVRDFDEPVELFQVTGRGLPTGFPPLRVLPADRHNLVGATTEIVGRDEDLGVLSQLVTSARLVTVVGPGGLGKTRLVTEFGIQRAGEWEHGAWFVDLAPLNDPALVAGTLADAIAAPSRGDADARARVLEYLGDRHALVIMDNCEHLTVAVARLVDDVLRGCPRVRVVATSREPLGLRGERVWRLSPLDPDDAAVDLFCNRAGLPDALDSPRRATVTELCRLLDGLPLAIELAAARCDVLGPGEIIARLGRQPGLLRSDDPTVSDRQHSVEETIAWSHELLSADEQRAFRRLSLFVAGFGLDASEAVVADDQLDAYDAPELVWSLVSKSLVAIEPAAGSTRYRMLETIRAFAHRQLLRSGELATVAIRLGHFYVDSYGAHLDKADVALLADRGREIDNIRGLVPTVAAHDEELAQHLACMIVVDHRRASPGAGRDEGLRLLDQLAAPTPTRVALLGEVARLAVDHGDVDVASRLLDDAQRLATEVGSPSWIDALVDQHRGVIAIQRGEIEQARAIALAALARPATPRGRSRLLNLLGMAASEQGAFDEAREATESSLAILAEIGDTQARAVDLGNLAEIEMLTGHHHAAAARQLQCLDLAIELGLVREVTSSWIVAARLAPMTGDWTTATRLQSAADTVMVRIGLSLYPADRALCDELLAAATTHLGTAEFRHQFEIGRTLPVTDATDEARRVLDGVAAAGP